MSDLKKGYIHMSNESDIVGEHLNRNQARVDLIAEIGCVALLALRNSGVFCLFSLASVGGYFGEYLWSIFYYKDFSLRGGIF